MNGILIYSEVEETALGLLTKGRDLAADLEKPLSIAMLGSEDSDQIEAFFAHGAAQVYVGNDPALAHFQAGVYAEALSQMIVQSECDIILVGSTRRGRELAPRLAQKLSAGCITDALTLSLQDGRLIIERRALGGSTIATKVVTSPIQVISVMPKRYEAEPGSVDVGEVVQVSLDLKPAAMEVVEQRPKESGTANLEEAEVLVCVGRGLNNKDDLALIHTLAEKLGGLVGCTRPISHDNHWLTEDQMVGLSGVEASPLLYLGVGVSGQIQHTVGIMDAKLIIAINSDPNAPIFKMADYGIVGDLYQVVPKLIDRIQNEFGR
jgi:electron transfer flavoprotein alpha subunit